MYDINMTIGIEKRSGLGIDNIKDIKIAMDKHNVKKAFVSSLYDAAPDLCEGKNIYEYFNNKYENIYPLPVWKDSYNIGDFFKKIKKFDAKSMILASTFVNADNNSDLKQLIKKAIDTGIKAVFLPLKANYIVAKRLNGWNNVYMLCKTFSDMKFIVTGMGRNDAKDLFRKLMECSNLYADTANLQTASVIERLVDAGYADRLLVGSGYGISYPTAFRDHIIFSDISNAAKEKILYKNAEQLFN